MSKALHPNKKRKKRLWVLIILEIAILLALVMGLVAILRVDPLEGNWYQQDRLVYKFGGNGKGVMVMEGDLARFSYSIRGDRLELDFFEENIPDRTYEFSLDGDVLILEDNSGEGPLQYIRKHN